jgi:hypothetical protein
MVPDVCNYSPEGIVEIEITTLVFGFISERYCIAAPVVSNIKPTDSVGIVDFGSHFT